MWFGRSPEAPRHSLARPLATILLATAAFGCTPEPLPEAGTEAAALYTERCGSCHRLYRPGALTSKMWEAMVTRMEIEMSRRGIALRVEDRETILDYLRRNAGTR
jgi:hypothetical protein